MNPIFEKIKSVGFDIDNTLYSNNPQMDKMIRGNIARKILKYQPELKTIEETLRVYEPIYAKTGSWTKILKEIGAPDSRREMTECVSDFSVTDLICSDARLQEIIKKIKKKYSTFLLTSNTEDLGSRKLNRLGIEKEVFDARYFGDHPAFTYKADGGIFKFLLENSPYKPDEHVYVGDNLVADILSSKKQGMKAIMVGGVAKEADYCIADIHEIEEVLL